MMREKLSKSIYNVVTVGGKWALWGVENDVFNGGCMINESRFGKKLKPIVL